MHRNDPWRYRHLSSLGLGLQRIKSKNSSRKSIRTSSVIAPLIGITLLFSSQPIEVQKELRASRRVSLTDTAPAVDILIWHLCPPPEMAYRLCPNLEVFHAPSVVGPRGTTRL